MSLAQAIVLGILQGATEFLPISSSGHLILARELMELPQTNLLFDVLLHVATLAVVCLVFRRRIGVLVLALVDLVRPSPQRRPEFVVERKTLLLLALTSVATVMVALGVRAADVPRTAVWTGGALIATAALLFVGWAVVRARTQPRSPTPAQAGWLWALGVGIAQGLAVLPGLSRAGATIAVGTATGVDRSAAAEFSFLASIPAIIGALVITLGDAVEMSADVSITTVVAATVAAAVSGYLALTLLLRLVRVGRLQLFALYLIPVGIWSLLQS